MFHILPKLCLWRSWKFTGLILTSLFWKVYLWCQKIKACKILAAQSGGGRGHRFAMLGPSSAPAGLGGTARSGKMAETCHSLWNLLESCCTFGRKWKTASKCCLWHTPDSLRDHLEVCSCTWRVTKSTFCLVFWIYRTPRPRHSKSIFVQESRFEVRLILLLVEMGVNLSTKMPCLKQYVSPAADTMQCSHTLHTWWKTLLGHVVPLGHPPKTGKTTNIFVDKSYYNNNYYYNYNYNNNHNHNHNDNYSNKNNYYYCYYYYYYYYNYNYKNKNKNKNNYYSYSYSY